MHLEKSPSKLPISRKTNDLQKLLDHVLEEIRPDLMIWNVIAVNAGNRTERHDHFTL